MNAIEKRWLSEVAKQPCVVTGNPIKQLHHVVGRTAKHNKVAIGHWWILPLSPHLHDVASNDPCNVTHHKKAFEAKYGTQKELFDQLCINMSMRPPVTVQAAIASYRR